MDVSSPTDVLFEPVRVRELELPNRIVFLPHVTFYAERQRPSARHRHYYEERARGGAGLIVSESQFVHPTGGHGKCVDASDPVGMKRWGEAIDAVHAHGALFFAQLTHHGPEAFTPDTLRPLWAPSAVPDPVVREIPRAMRLAEIEEAQEAFAAAAANAVAAGFDGVELKIGHDGLLRAFLSPASNRRQDAYGGSREARLRFVVETIERVREAVGDLPLGARICLDEGWPGGYDLDEGVELARALAATGRLDYVSSDLGSWPAVDVMIPPMTSPEGSADAATGRLRAATGLPTIAFGGIRDPAHAARIVTDGTAELVGLARQLITDPCWPAKVRSGRAAEIRPCVACNQECVGRLARELPISCVHNPAAGREASLGHATRRPAARSRRVVVAGGGPAGLKAAETAALRGHDVVLLERSDALGGQVALAATAHEHALWGGIVTHLEHELDRLGVTVRLGCEASVETVLAERPAAVIVAVGAGPDAVPFPVGGDVVVLDEWQALTGAEPREQSVLVVDLGVRFEGAAIVETLAARGNRVRWAAPTPSVPFEVDPSTLLALLPRIGAAGVERLPESIVVDARDGVTLFDVMTRTATQLHDVDVIVVVGNKRSHTGLEDALTGRVELHAVGDCVAPRHTAIAILEGERAGRKVR